MANQFTPAIQQLYVAYFNRPADPAGLTFWEGIAAAQGNTDAIVTAFSQQPEYVNAYKGLTNDQIVAKVYNNLFGHGPDLAGLDFWSNALAKGAATVADIVLAVGTGAQGTDAVALESKVTAAVTFTDALDTVEERLAYSGDGLTIGATYLAGVKDEASLQTAIDNIDQTTGDLVNQIPGNPVVNHTLTEGIDKLVGTAADDNYVAVDKAWSALDTINGGAGNNSLTVAQSAALGNIPAGITLTNIQTVNLVAGDEVDTNVSAWTGVKTLTVTAGDSAGSVLVDRAAGDVSVANSSGNDVTVNRAAATAAITVDSVGDVYLGNGAQSGGQSATVVNSAAESYADIVALDDAATAASNAAATAGSAVTTAGNKVTTLGNLTTALNAATTVAGNNAATLTALNAGVITRDQKIAIDAAFAAGLKTNVAAAVAAALAIETPIVTAAVAAKANADSAKAIADAADADAANALSDALSVTGADYSINTTTLKTLSLSGNLTGSVSVHDNSTLGNVLTSVEIDTSNDIALQGNALTSVSLKNVDANFAAGTGEVVITNTTLNHVQNLTLENVGADIKDLNAGTVNIVSNGDGNASVVTASSATVVNISGAASLDLLGSAFAANAVITASDATGDVALEVTEGQTFTGGTGADYVYVSSTAAQTKVIDGGAGNDTLVLHDALSYSTNAAAAKFVSFEALEVDAAISVDLTKFTGSTFASLAAVGGATLTGITAAQAAHVTQTSATSLTLGVTGATTVGQVDTVHLTVNNGVSGRQTINIGTPAIAGVENLQLTAVDTVVIDALTGMTALNSLVIDGSGGATVTTGALALNVNTVIDAHAATRAVTIDAGLSTTNGLKIIGSDTANSTLTASVAAGKDSVLIAGNGVNNLTSYGGNDVLTSGNGNSALNAGNGNNTVTVGNGFNTITTGTGNDTIKVGTGGNTIVTGAGNDKVTLAEHVAGVVNYVVSGSLDVTAGNTAVGSANSDTITGFISGQDKLQFNAGLFNGTTDITVAAGAAFATLLGAVSDATDVATSAAVYTRLATALDNTAGHEFAASTSGSLVARVVTFTTGDAAGSYLVINNGDAGFSATDDIVVKLVGNTAIVAGDLQIIA